MATRAFACAVRYRPSSGLGTRRFSAGLFIFLMLIGNAYGTEAFGLQHGVNILAVCMTVGFGFSIAGSTLVGQHLGARDP